MSKKSEAKPVDLQSKLVELRKEARDYRRALVANELPNPRVITSTRKEIARTLTAINAARKVKEHTNA